MILMQSSPSLQGQKKVSEGWMDLDYQMCSRLECSKEKDKPKTKKKTKTKTAGDRWSMMMKSTPGWNVSEGEADVQVRVTECKSVAEM